MSSPLPISQQERASLPQQIHESPAPHIEEVKVSQLVPVGEFDGMIQAREEAHEAAVKNHRAYTRCHVIALAVLTLIAGALAATLIAFSGGPSNLQLFLPGVVFGTVALSLTAWAIFGVLKSLKDQRKAEAELSACQSEVVSLDRVFSSLKNPTTSEEQIQQVLTNFSEQQRLEFIKNLRDSAFLIPLYKKEELSEGDKRLVIVIAKHFIDDLNKLKKMDQSVEELKDGCRDFSFLVLENIPENTASEKLQNWVEFAPNSEEENKIYARHPEALAVLVQNQPEKFTTKTAASIYSCMNSDLSKAKFLERLKTDHLTLTQEKLTLNEEKPELDQKLQAIQKVAEACVSISLNVDFGNVFSKENQENISLGSSALLAQLARWPELTGKFLYLNYELQKNPGFVEDLYAKMDAEDKDKMVNYVAGVVIPDLITNVPSSSQKSYSALTEQIKNIIAHYARKTLPLPEPTLRIYAKFPQLLGTVATQPFPNETMEAGKIFASIVAKMNPEQKYQYFIRKGSEPKRLEEMMKIHLKGLMQIPKGKQQEGFNVPAVRYLMEHPKEFSKYVLSDKLEADNKLCVKFALDLLEYLQAFEVKVGDKKTNAAEAIIFFVDSATPVGRPNFVSLINTLIKEAETLGSEKNVSQTRGTLMARFMQAPNVKAAKKLLLGVSIDDFQNSNFQNNANQYLNEVWKVELK